MILPEGWKVVFSSSLRARGRQSARALVLLLPFTVVTCDEGFTGPDAQEQVRRHFAYVPTSDGVSVIDTESHAVVDNLDVGGSLDVAFSPDGTMAYVLGTGGAEAVLSVVDTRTHAVMATIEGIPGKSVAVAPDGDHLHVLTWGDAVLGNLCTGLAGLVTSATAPARRRGDEGIAVATSRSRNDRDGAVPS